MARPTRYNAEFFYHPANLRDDRRVKAIRANCGTLGYAVLVMLLETLTNADHTQLDTSELELELLAGDYGVSVTEIHRLIQIAEKVGYFARNEAGLLICPDLNKALEPVFDKRNRSRAATGSSKNTQKAETAGVSVTETPAESAINGVSVTESTQSKVEESTVKETKVSSPSSSSSTRGQESDTLKTESEPDGAESKTSGDSYFHFSVQIKAERQFIESACMSLKISEANLPGLIDQFTHEQRALQKQYPEYADYKSHCFNWLRIQSTKTPVTNANARSTPALSVAYRAPGPTNAFGQGADLSGKTYQQEGFK